MSATGRSTETVAEARWADVPARLRARGLRWTPRRRALLDVLARVDGHVTASELIEDLRETDPSTTPSTVYRTLDVLEDLGLVSHSHGADGRAEFHVSPRDRHGHLRCTRCGETWELDVDELGSLADDLRARHGFEAAVEHLTVEGRCAACRGEASATD